MAKKITYLEELLVQEIEQISKLQNFQRRQTEKLYLIVDTIFSYSRMLKENDFSYVPIPRKQWINLINGKYSTYINILKENDIIESDETYSKEVGKVKNYRISLRFGKELTLLKVQYDKKSKKKGNPTKYTSELQRFYDTHINNFNDDEFSTILNQEVDGINDSEKKMKMRYWLSSYDNLKIGNIYCKKSKSNHRLNSNFTNMPKKLRRLLMKWNDLGEVDMIASQPTLLSNMMMKDDELEYDTDISYFNLLCSTGTLYETLMKEWNMTRERVKQTLFYIIYSHPDLKNTKAHADFRKLFEPVLNYITDKKKSYPNWKQFSVELQRFEASIWINSIKTCLSDNHIIHTTVHDSVIVSNTELKLSKELIERTLKQINIKGKVAV